MAEQRAHRRLAVDFDAFVTAGGLRDHPCKVRDFCLGGVLLCFDDPLRQAPPALSQLDRGAAIELRVLTRTPGFRDAYSFTATVARRDKLHLGVAFNQPDPTALMALQSLATVNSSQLRGAPRPERRKPRPDDASVRAVMAELRELVAGAISGLPQALFRQAREVVEGLAASAATDEERHRVMDSLGLLKRHANNVQSAFLQQALKPIAEFDKWQTGAIVPAASNTYRLSLIEKGAFEDWLAIKVMVSRAESECQESLFELHIRLNELLGTTLSVQSNPVGPAVFFHALGEPLQKLRLPKPVEQGVLRALEAILLESLSGLYPALNTALVHHGVMPDLELGKYLRAVGQESKPRAPRPASGAAPESAIPAGSPGAVAGVSTGMSGPTNAGGGGAAAIAAGEAPAAAIADAPAGDAAPAPVVDRAGAQAALSVRRFEMQQRIAQQSFGVVQRLLAVRLGDAPAANPGASDAARTHAAPDVSGLLQRLAVAPPSDGATTLASRLAAAGDADALGAQQLAAVETVDEIFLHLLESSLLREDTRGLLRQLDLPYLKVMLSDPAFLSDEAHPARQVINRLAALGARGALTSVEQQARIGEVVAGLRDGDGDPASFQRALGELEELYARQQRVYEHNLKRVQDASVGKQRIAAAQRQVNEVVESMVGGRRVPRALLTLLDVGWRDSMVSALLRGGQQGAEFRELAEVIQQMLDGVADPAALDLKTMLAAIKRGLASQANSQLNREAVIADLRDMFTAITSGHPEHIACVDMPVGAVVVGDTPVPDTDSHVLGRWVRRAREFAPGDWVEFLADSGEETHVARLAWHDEERTQFVFVNLQGMKVDELGIEKFARMLRDTRAWRVEDPDMPVVDRSLEAMVQKVYGQLAHRATHDELTGLLNRKEFEKRLQRQADQLEPGSPPWLLCWLDLDQFKVINSTCGFEAGDRLIREVGDAIVACVGEQAQVARLGGDEFAILAPAAVDNGRPVGHIIEAIDTLRFQWEGKTYPVGASAGVVFVNPRGPLADELMKCAETACYAAKEAGRNRVQVFQSDDAQLARRDDIIQWVSRLNQALEKDRLQLRCQLIRPVDEQSGLMPHYEILIAIEDENGEFIPPSSFMQAAERYNRMHAVDRWVIHNVLAWMHDNPVRMAEIGGFSINLSGQSLNDEKLTSWILSEIGDSAVAREKVTFEVTETAAIANLADAAEFIRDMQAIGCRFSLDDFGSGLSSYSYLKNLPVDFVKIDGVFIKEIHRNPSDYMMVRSINEMAHFMGKRTIAEYVENDEILEKLREIGVDFAQGYGIERPRPLETLG